MEKALKTQQKKGIEALKEVETDKYNGVDVKRVKNGSKSLIGYLPE